MTERRPYFDAANIYYRSGWSNPLPVEGKGPPPSGHTGYDGKNVTWPQLNAWMSEQAGRNIAVRLPGDLVGIDVDAYDGKTGAESLAAAVAELGPLPATCRSTARAPFGESGIWFYRVPVDRSLRGAEKRFASRFGDHVDIIRRDHRYAVVWPSIHPDTGGMYLWYGPDGEQLSAPPRPADLAELPPAWLDFLADPVPSTGPAGASASAPPSSTAEAPAVSEPGEVRTDRVEPRSASPWDLPRTFTETQAVDFVRPSFERLRTAPDGTINNRLNEASVMIGHFVPLFWSRLDAEAWLLDALSSTVYDGRTWKAEATIASGLGARTWRAERTAEPVADEPAAEVEEDRFPPLDWAALWGDDSPEEWIVNPILPARRGVALYSPPKIGKSLLALEVAVGIARAGNVLGIQVDRPRKVLYVDFENDPKGDVRPRLVDMGYGPADLANLVYLSFPPLGPLDTAIGAAELLGQVERHAAEVVIIDTVSRAVKGEENENDTWLAFYRYLGKELKARGVAMLRLDHTGKDEAKGQRGGSAKSGDVDMVWRLSRVTEDAYQLDCEAHRMQVMEKTLVLHRETEPRLWHRVDATGASGAWRAKVAEVNAALDAAGVPADAGRDRCRAALTMAGVECRNNSLAHIIKDRKRLTGPFEEPVRDRSERSTILRPVPEGRGQVVPDGA